MPLYFSPVGNDQTFDANGDPLTGGQIETYIASSSTPLATFTDDTGSTPQSNPIILNSLGYPTLGAVWLTGGQSYKFVIKDAMGVTLRTIDNISGINDASVSQSEWVVSGFTPTYINATSFSVPGDQTAVLQINRRLRTTNTSGFIYSTITNSVFAAGITTVTVANDSGVLDAGLSVVEYALLAPSPSSIPAISVTRFTQTARRVLGRNESTNGPVEELTTSELALMVPSRIQPISASVGSNALTITLNPTTLDFRSATLGSGQVNTREVVTPITLTISSGSTLGTTNGVLSRIVVMAMDNAGTVELAAMNLEGGNSIDETTLLTTTAEGGAGGADSLTGIYSTTARSNLPYRVVGYIESTQATAGTWATAPSRVQGAGGTSLSRLQTFGYLQTIQDLTGSRSLATDYTNSTGRPIQFYVRAAGSNSGGVCAFQIRISGAIVGYAVTSESNGAVFNPVQHTLTGVVPPGATYRAESAALSNNLIAWHELR